jgi:hypothetical protein
MAAMAAMAGVSLRFPGLAAMAPMEAEVEAE